MTIEVKVISGRVGSNPGGRCLIINGGFDPFPAYYKFCYGSHIGGVIPLQVKNQPIYEAITAELARKLGLKTPKSFVLLNLKRDVIFKDWRRYSDSQDAHDPSGRKAYFVSRLVNNPQIMGRGEKANAALESERPYLESLLIADVINKKENYVFYDNGNMHGGGEVLYLDLGCSFVHAVRGFLEQPNKLEIDSERECRRAMSRLKRLFLIGADNDRIINLYDLIQSIPNTEVPTLNPLGTFPINYLLAPEEIEYTSKLILQGFDKALPIFEKRELLIKQ